MWRNHTLAAERLLPIHSLVGYEKACAETIDTNTRVGRPSIAPQKLLRAQLLQMLYTIRSERLLMEEMDYNLLFRWFVGLNADHDVWMRPCAPRIETVCWQLRRQSASEHQSDFDRFVIREHAGVGELRTLRP